MDDEDRVGEDVRDGEEVRCAGFLPTGGGFLDVEPFVEVERRRSLLVGIGCVEGGEGRVVEEIGPSRDVWESVEANEATAEGLKGGGSLRVPLVAWRGLGGGGVKEAGI